MTDPRIEAAVDAVIKARGWRDRCWGDGAIGGYDYSTPEKKRYVIRDHAAEARGKATVILFETDDCQEYEREFTRACIRRELSAALAAADAAAWRPIETAPMDGTEIIAFGTQKADAVSTIEPYLGVVWRAYGLWQDGTIACRPSLTHWHPLPAPPADTQEFGGRD